MSDSTQQTTKYFCAYCKQYIEKSQFKIHKIFHRNDPNVMNHPETLEEMKQHFEMIGMYDEI